MTKRGKWEMAKTYGGAVLPCAFFSDSIRQSLILIEQLFGVHAPVASECMSLPLVSFDRGFGLSALTPDRGLGAGGQGGLGSGLVVAKGGLVVAW